MILALVLSLSLGAKHAYTVDDQVRLRRLSALAVSPDGSKLVLTVRATEYEKNKGSVDLFALNADGSGMRQLTSHSAPESDAAFSADGKSIYFLAPRGETQQLWRLSLEGGEAEAVTKLPLDVNAYQVSPDGKTLVFSSEVFLDCTGDLLDCTAKRLEKLKDPHPSGQVYEQLMVRHWDTWGDGRRAHLFSMPLAGGPVKHLMAKMDTDVPGKPFGGAEDFTFSPDSKQVVFSAKDAGREEAWSTNFDLFAVPVDGSKPPAKLTTNPGADAVPTFSPDGKTLVWLAQARAGYESDKFTVMVRDWPNGKDRALTDKWDHSAEQLGFSPDSKTLYVSAWNVGQQSLFALPMDGSEPKTVVEKGHVATFKVAADGKRVFLALDSLEFPGDLFSVEAGGQPKKLTTLNPNMAEIKLGQPEQFSFEGANGEKVYGYLVKPVDFDPKKKYPVAFLIHGGPQGSMANDWHYRWNPQVYAGHGYAAVMIDFHGSTGYGQAFTDAIRDDWGGKPLEDLKKGLAYALGKYPFLDGGRACALGASYGGYAINLIAGVWNQPFKCLVSHDGNLDERFAYFATEELWFPEWEHKGTPWVNPAGYAKNNPLDHIDQWKLPMLVVHGGKDYRVVDTEGLSTFTVLQRKGIPSKLLYFPDENHWVLKPQNSVQWHKTVLDWLDQWTKK
ncbi:MAG: S9 family peptidase [Myxococcaceae bacterium]